MRILEAKVKKCGLSLPVLLYQVRGVFQQKCPRFFRHPPKLPSTTTLQAICRWERFGHSCFLSEAVTPAIESRLSLDA
ncbi:hypothetical protein RRG08_020713 [Elysia crispata]|uniref:Uncharacterized protein n=1 Tax=Elysia crispata TaxID=231223 RepID=A0AAE1B2H0_9GAST|nr:hypothetical protein RRG08_020713 [Elysia crispata]